MGSGLGSVQLRWEEPLEDGGAELTSYSVYYRRTGVDTEWTKHSASLKYSQLSFEMSGLAHNSQYSFKVTAANVKGESAFSQTVHQYTSAVPSLLIEPALVPNSRTEDSIGIQMFEPGVSTSDVLGF